MIDRFEQFTGAIASIYKSIVKIERAELAQYGLKAPHTQCLLTLKQYPEGITAARLCEICDRDKAAISRTVAELEELGLVRREDPNGKRYRSCLKLTPQGTQTAQHVNELVYAAVTQASAGYDARQREVFISVLSMIAENLQDICRKGLAEEGGYV